MEALKLRYGGVSCLARLFGCGRELIDHGQEELEQRADGDSVGNRIRRPGAGRPVTEGSHPEVVKQLEQTLKHRSAGDPMDDTALWTDLRPRELGEHTGTRVSDGIVRRMLKLPGCGLRKIAKATPQQVLHAAGNTVGTDVRSDDDPVFSSNLSDTFHGFVINSPDRVRCRLFEVVNRVVRINQVHLENQYTFHSSVSRSNFRSGDLVSEIMRCRPSDRRTDQSSP